MSEVYVCPWWMGYFLVNPLRKYSQNPENILKPYIKSGCHVLEIGPGMGFFTLPAAELAGSSGIVYTVDIQQKMLNRLKKRASNKHLDERIDCRLCTNDSFCIDDLNNTIDFCLLMYVVHEIPKPFSLFADITKAVKPGGKVLFSEPKGHVKTIEFEKSISILEASGFRVTERPDIKRSLSALLLKE